VFREIFEFSPLGRNVLGERVTVPKQRLKLMSEHRPADRAVFLHLWPPTESTSAEAFLANPVSLPVIDQYLQRGGCTIAEDEHTPGEGVVSEYLTAYTAQAIDALPEVLRLHRDEDSHLGRNLDHDLWLQKARIIPTGSRWGL